MDNPEHQNFEIKKPEQQPNKFGQWLKISITARMLMVGALILILLIPLT